MHTESFLIQIHVTNTFYPNKSNTEARHAKPKADNLIFQ